MSTIKANTLLHSDGSTTNPPAIPALDKRMVTAWVSWNGIGTVSIYSSENVSSITDAGVGLFTVNFATALANTNWVAVMSTQENNGSTHSSSNNRVIGPARVARNVNNCMVRAANPSDYSTRDNARNDVLIMGGRA